MTDSDKNSTQVEAKREGWERDALERLLLASVKEQRRARRWGIFFKLFFAGLLVLILVLAQSGTWEEGPPAGKYTALVDLDGVISADSAASADNVIRSLRRAFAATGTQGVILESNSPGGSPVQAGYIYDEIRRLRQEHPKIPVYAVISDICASGCYYVASATDKIYANPASMVGSIGVLMDGFGFVGTLQKLGVERRLLTAGQHKGFLDPFEPMRASDRAYAQHMLDEIHNQFIAAVEAGRGKALKTGDKELFSGLVWTGTDALKLGLVDGFGSARYVAREVIGARDIVNFTYRENLFDRFARRIGTTMADTLAAKVLMSTPQLR